MNIVLWVIQVLVALAFLMAGFMKTFQPIEKLKDQMTWVTAVPPAFVRFIGIAELLGGVGLILPALTHILPWLTIAAAVGLVIAMISATVFHIARGEVSPRLVAPVVLLLLAAIIVIGRWVWVPLA